MARTSKQQLAQILAPLTVLHGADRMTEGHWNAYHAVLGEFYPHELKAVAKKLFTSSEYWPTPKKLLDLLKRERQILGSNALDRVQAVAAGLPDPGPVRQLTDAERLAILEAVPGAKQIGSAKGSEGRR